VLPNDPRADRATLTMLSGPEAGATFRVEDAHTTLGRSTRASIPIDEFSVSRMHARITREGDGRYVSPIAGERGEVTRRSDRHGARASLTRL
jgi:pSer/pThr/pTyr-binding forkhead associated (FHA) protein